MKKLLLILFLLPSSFVLYCQEICNNALDDDGDTFIDLNDEDCDCEGFGSVTESLFPNPSFEARSCCPSGPSQMTCVDAWDQCSGATSDYYNFCDLTWAGFLPMFPLPGGPGGEGFVGFFSVKMDESNNYLEYIGTKDLLSPLLAGTSYSLKLYTAYAQGDLNLEFSLFGTPDEDDLPWIGSECPNGIGSWDFLTSEDITYSPDGAWQEVTFTFTPTVDLNAIAIGGPCEIGGLADLGGYYYMDGLTFIKNFGGGSITKSGSFCNDDVLLTATSDTTGGSWQWYKDGIALLGETGSSVDADLYGFGEYSAVYSVGGNCVRTDFPELNLTEINADFNFTIGCFGVETNFTNTTIHDDGIDPTWFWDFGDGATSTMENPSHTYGSAGTFLVKLLAMNEEGCNDSIEFEVTLEPNPLADFEFVVGDFSSEDGLTGACIESTIQFNDLSTIADPGIITSWNWDFGDGGSSSEENPTYIYAMIGTYTVTLTVTTDNGCSSTYSLDINITEYLDLDLITSEPTCYGYTDGSIIVIGGGDDPIFLITDVDGNIVNEDSSNTAIGLGSGWYFIEVNGGSGCNGNDSIFLNQPSQMVVELTIFDSLCNGLETGWAVVDTVTNFTGDYDQISYFWNPNPAGVNGIGADSTWGLTNGSYELTVSDENGCSNTVNFEIKISSPLVFTIDARPALCRTFGYQNGNGVVFGDVTGGVPDYTYLWTDLTTGETTPNTTWGGRNPGNYQFTVTDANGCVVDTTVFLDSINPQAIFAVNSAQLNAANQGTAPVEVEFINESINFAQADDPLSDTTFFWSLDNPNADWSITHDYFEVKDTTYLARGQSYEVEVCLIALNKNNCSDTACKILTIYEPIKFSDVNIFSPNGDGINDVFTFQFKAASIAEFECVIVNRWGIVITELTSITDGWDGRANNGALVEDGVYFYSYKARTDNNTQLTGQGNVQVIGGK